LVDVGLGEVLHCPKSTSPALTMCHEPSFGRPLHVNQELCYRCILLSLTTPQTRRRLIFKTHFAWTVLAALTQLCDFERLGDGFNKPLVRGLCNDPNHAECEWVYTEMSLCGGIDRTSSHAMRINSAGPLIPGVTLARATMRSHARSPNQMCLLTRFSPGMTTGSNR